MRIVRTAVMGPEGQEGGTAADGAVGATRNITPDTLPYWLLRGWKVDVNDDGVADEAGSPTSVSDGSLTPAKLAPNGTTPDGTKAYHGDGTWKVPAGGGGGAAFTSALTQVFQTALTSQPATGQKVATLNAVTNLTPGWTVILGADLNTAERKVVASVAGNDVTFTTNINGVHPTTELVVYANQALDTDYLTAATYQQVTGGKDFRGLLRVERPVPVDPNTTGYEVGLDFVNSIFRSRAAGGGGIVAKAAGDQSAGIIDWIHAGTTVNSGYLLHLTHATNTSLGTLIGLGVQGNGGGGLLIAKDGPKGVGIYIDQKGVVTDPTANGLAIVQNSRYADALLLQQSQPGVAPTLKLLSGGHSPFPGQRLLEVQASTLPQTVIGYIDPYLGWLAWRQPIVADGTLTNTAASLRFKGKGTLSNHVFIDEALAQPGGTTDSGPAVRLYAATGTVVYSGQIRMSKNLQGLILAVGNSGVARGRESMRTAVEVGPSTTRFVGSNVENAPLGVPAPTLAVGGTPGSTTYGYRVAAVNAKGTTQASATVTTSTGPATLTATDKITVSWPHVSGADSYRVYGRTSGSELLLATVGQPTRTVSDAKIAAVNTRTVTDVVTVAQNNNITSATAAFTAEDVGRRVEIPGQGYLNNKLETYITAVVNATTATLGYSPNSSASGVTATISSPALQTLESATAAFTVADVGKSVAITGAAAAGAVLTATIEQYINGSKVLIDIAASTSVTGASLTITGGTPALSFVDDGTLTPAGALPGAPAGQTVKTTPWLGQSGNVEEWYDNTHAMTMRFNRDGRMIGLKTTAPILGDLADGSHTFWTDPATGDLKVSTRAGGVLRTGTVTVVA